MYYLEIIACYSRIIESYNRFIASYIDIIASDNSIIASCSNIIGSDNGIIAPNNGIIESCIVLSPSRSRKTLFDIKKTLWILKMVDKPPFIWHIFEMQQPNFF